MGVTSMVLDEGSLAAPITRSAVYRLLGAILYGPGYRDCRSVIPEACLLYLQRSVGRYLKANPARISPPFTTEVGRPTVSSSHCCPNSARKECRLRRAPGYSGG